jgi:hypothetical protein
LRRHSDEGNDMGFDEEMGVPVLNLFDGAAQGANGHEDTPGRTIRSKHDSAEGYTVTVSRRRGQIRRPRDDFQALLKEMEAKQPTAP